MSNKTIVITGASTGIGRATALYFAEKGWNVAATMRTPEKEVELQNMKNIKVYPLDVTKQPSIDESYQSITTDFEKVDVLLNNAGYCLGGPFETSTDTQIRAEFDVNVFGLMNVTKSFLPHFRENQEGIIINVSSMGGKITFPMISTYHATKFCVEGFTEAVSYELAPFGIKVKLIEPGNIATDFGTRSMQISENWKDSAYSEAFSAYMQSVASADSSIYGQPKMVAEVIYTAAVDGSDQMRYVAGEDAKNLIDFKKQNGDDAFIQMMKNYRL